MMLVIAPSGKFVGLRTSSTRNFPNGGHYQGTKTGYGGGNNKDRVLAVAPLEEVEASTPFEVHNVGNLFQLDCLNNGSYQCPKRLVSFECTFQVKL